MEHVSKTKRVAVLTGLDGGYSRQVVRGVTAYVRPTRPWLMQFAAPTFDALALLRRWRPHGILGSISEPQFAAALRRLKTPVVNWASSGVDLPHVGVDNDAIARLAADYLLRRGFRHLAYCGVSLYSYSRQRGAAFHAALRAHQLIADDFEVGSHIGSDSSWGWAWAPAEPRLKRWLARLPRPAAIFACNDPLAVVLSEACHELGLRIPEDVALLGVTDDDVVCEMAYPPISSIGVPQRRIGFESARLLDRMMSARTAQPQAALKTRDQGGTSMLFGPTGVTTRQSSDILATADRQVATALRFIREHLDEPIQIADVARTAGLNRRVLEKRFRAVMSQSPLATIREARLERARRLLAETDLAVHDIASMCGFRSPERMSKVFRQILNCSPSGFRQQTEP